MLACAAPASAAEKTYKLRFGPLTVAGYQVRTDTSPVRTPKVNGFITAMRARVVDRRGRHIPVNRVMLHHVLFVNKGRFDGDRHDGACPATPRERFFGTGEENQVVRLPPGYGIPIRRGDRWQAPWMLMNHKLRTEVAYVEYSVTVETGRQLTPAKAYWLDVTGCGGTVAYSVPGGGAPGSTDTRSVTWTVPANGRLLAGGAHLHGGAKGIRLLQQRCENRDLATSHPLYGMPSNIVYHVLPVLHEPGPINTSWFSTAKGIPLAGGEQITVAGDYDGEFPHARVMAIEHVYFAAGGAAPATCDPPPDDLSNTNVSVPGRPAPPYVRVPLTGLGPNGRARTIDRPPGRTTTLNGSASIAVRGSSFQYPNLSIPLGASLTWSFPDVVRHSVTLANGPEAFSSPNLRNGRSYTQTFTRPGQYQLFCALHPVFMQQVVDVRPGAAPGATPKLRAAPPAQSPAAGDQIHW